jgi:pimeloyl-ACP methyl ester carboxylesterase
MWATLPAANVAATSAPKVIRVACSPHHLRERCGFVSVPLDRRHPNGRRIKIYFEHYLRRQTSKPATSTVVSIEGGPGYSTTADRGFRLQVWRPVNARRGLVLIDLRGTGKSHAIMCPAFKLHSTGYPARGGRCAKQLGPDRDFYDTSQSVQDMQAVLLALHAGKIDLYGDSYGSYAAQAFALRYPHRLRSLVLDGTYPLAGTDPLLSDLSIRSRKAIQISCARGPNCPVSPAQASPLLQRFIARVRAHPIVGTSYDPYGDRVKTRVNEDTMAQTVMAAEGDTTVYRDLLAAVISANHGDPAPILRLVAENIIYDGPNGSPRYFSEALYLDVYCHDYPQPWSTSTPMANRRAVALADLNSRPASDFAPFSGSGWTGTDYEGAFSCLHWPSPAFADPPVPPHTAYPNVPTLIMAGDLDNITPIQDGRIVAGQFPQSTLVDVHNQVHVTVLEDEFGCAAKIYERFVRSLKPGDTSCAAHTPPLRVVGRFPLHLRNVTAAHSTTGDRSTLRDRRMAAAGAETVADTLAHWWTDYGGPGLRGGSWSYTGVNTTRFMFKKTQFVPGVAVTGNVTWRYYSGLVSGAVTVVAGATTEHVHLRWSLNQAGSQATITGTSAGRPVHLRMLAP